MEQLLNELKSKYKIHQFISVWRRGCFVYLVYMYYFQSRNESNSKNAIDRLNKKFNKAPCTCF